MTDNSHVLLDSLLASNIPATGEVKVVRRRDLEGFYVSRLPRGHWQRYEVRNGTAFMAPKRALTIGEVRKIIEAAP